ncbi:ATP synthase mitochondrial f1 complex assembly factor 2 [Pseudohyphozyma bogoriensis]|nr:ATP synthase mitochondrial f1 complex assembly factor 2 [Pseudohyphozyma bogoriensis]
MFSAATRTALRAAARSTARNVATEAVAPAASSSEPQTARAEKLLKRFWKTVAVEKKPDGHYGVMLDKRTLKTPGGKPLLLKDHQLPVAVLIADEWENQYAVLKPHALPMTSITARALDGLHDASLREAVSKDLLRYLDTDTVCFHEEFPRALVKLQDEHWKPLLAWVSKTFDVEVKVYEGILGTKQPKETMEKLGAVVSQYDQFKLAAFERAVLASKSYLIALALVEGYFTTDEAAKAAHVEVQSQIDRWGEVEDTHDVDHQDVRVRLGSAALMLARKVSEAILKRYAFDEDKTTVLDFACGPGLVSQNLAPHCKRVVGVDLSKGMVDFFNKAVSDHGIDSSEMEAFQRDVLQDTDEELNGELFDVVVCSQSYHHIPDIDSITRALSRRLKPNGVLMVLDLDAENGFQNRLAKKMSKEDGEKFDQVVAHKGGFSKEELTANFEQSGRLTDIKVEPAFTMLLSEMKEIKGKHNWAEKVGGDDVELGLLIATGVRTA